MQGGDNEGGGEEDDEGQNGTGDEGDAAIEVEEGPSDDKFESATSTPWSEEVGMYDLLDGPYSAGLFRPTPDSVIDATTPQLRTLQCSMRRSNVEFHRTRRRVWDLNGSGWKLL